MQKWSKRHRMKIITTHIPHHCPHSFLTEGNSIKVRACARILNHGDNTRKRTFVFKSTVKVPPFLTHKISLIFGAVI